MAFSWKSLLERLDPRKLRIPALAPMRDWVFANRTVVLSTSLALLVGLWGGAVLGRVSAGAPALDFAQLGSIGAGERARSASAARAGEALPDGMAFVRLRTEMNQADPRACLEFTRPLNPNTNYADYLTLEPAAPYQIDVSGTLLCLGGLPFEPDRQVTIRQGLPSQSGERTEADETFMLTFGDRPAYVGFAGGGVILPRAEADGIAIETVNVSRIEIEVLRVNDRIFSQHQLEAGETNEEGGWGYWSFQSAGEGVGTRVYLGRIDIDNTNRRNTAVTTVFALGAALNEMRPGAYVVKVRDVSPGAGGRGQESDSVASAYRWILYTDMALQTFSGATGLDIVVRSLRTARPMANVTLTLIAQNNEELARARTDANGRVRFAQALVNGEGPARARYVMAYGERGDYAALDLNRPGLDLSDRGVDGRRAPGDVDAYLYTERGIYRPGENVRLIGLIRDQVGRALTNRQSTLVIYRPNGTELRRIRLAEAADAGVVARNVALDRNAPRGVWRAVLTVDGQEAPAGEVTFSVEDFVPQRLRVRITAEEAVLRAGQARPISVQADFLYGAPGSGLAVEAEGRLMVDPTPFPEFRTFTFGRADESFDERMFQLPGTVTDGQGAAQLLMQVQDVPDTTLPLRARVIASVADPGGRMVRESFTVPVRTRDLYIGLAPQFENRRAGAGERVAYDVITLNAAGHRVGVRGLQWQLVREDWSYDWYLDNGSWRWRRTGRDIPVDGAAVDVAANTPLRIAKDGLRSGSYRLIVRDPRTGAETSQRFGVGWGGPADDDATPDMVTVVGPTDPVRPGGRARVQIRPPYAGEAQIVVATDRVIEMRTVRVSAEGTTVDLPVNAEWGSGAYILVTVMTPRDPVALPVPRRAIGVAYVPVNMENRTLEVAVGQGLRNVRPNTRVEIPVQVRNVPGGDRVRVAIALVDEGILNLTRYESPNPVDYFFGRRALGVDVRDDYGRLLNPNLGAPARARQGGDSIGGEGLTVVPTRTVAIVSDIVEVRGGRAVIPLDIPDFNGTLRLMAVAWSENALGQAAEQVIVRDPVVAELILPRFLAPGDEAQATLNIDNVEGPPGAYTVTVSGATTARIASQPRRIQLARAQRQTVLIPMTGGPLGVGEISLRVEGPQGFTPISRTYQIQSRAPFLPITQVQTEPLNTGVTWRAPGDALTRFQPGGQALISFSNLAGLDPAPLLDELYRYPYGCTEQLVSVALPLLYYNTLAAETNRERDPRIARRVQEAITQILDRQTPDGAIGLWSAGDSNATPWIGAYAVDFLQRAQRAGYVVPRQPMAQAYAGLRRVARLTDHGAVAYQFNVERWPGSNDTTALLRSRAAAYALYVLARGGEADIGQLRYFHDTHLANDPSPLARAQIAAALAHMGDRARSRNAFRMAERALGYRNTGDWYQSPLRDLAGVLALAAEAGETEMVARLRTRLEREAPDAGRLMTQEQVQLLLAANALMERAGPVTVQLNGQPMPERRVFADAGRLATGLVFRNAGRGAVWRTLQVSGAPIEAPPAMSAGYSIDKRVFRLDGTVADLDSIRQGDRVIIVISGQPEGVRTYPTVLVDLLPAGLEIESVLRPEDGMQPQQWDGTRRAGPFSWIGEITPTQVAEARDDRYVVSANLRGTYRYAYIARAVSPGRYTLPAAQVEDMYRPGVMARTSTGVIRIAPRGG